MTSPLDAHREQLVRLLELVQREQARRQGYDGADPREELICQLVEMGRRLIALNNWRKPTTGHVSMSFVFRSTCRRPRP